MAGVDLVRVGELGQALQGVEQPLRTLARVHCEIGPRGVADEQRVAGQHEALVDDECAVLGAVTGRVEHAHGHRAGMQRLPVLERIERKLGLGQRMHRHGHAVLQREAPVPGDVIGMRVRLEHAHDVNTFRGGGVDVLLDRVGGVDHEGFAAGVIPDQVRGAAEIVVDELAEQHKEEANTGCR